MAYFVATSGQVDKLCEMFGIKAAQCERLVIDIKVGEIVRAYVNVLGDFDKPYGEALVEVLGTAEWTAEEINATD